MRFGVSTDYYTVITEEFDADLEAIRLLVNAFKDSPTSVPPKARVAAANSAILLLAAAFEEFVREMARTYAKAVVDATHSFEKLPQRMANTAWRRTMETLAHIRIDTNTKGVSAETAISDAQKQFTAVYRFCKGDLSQDIYNTLIHNENNMRPGEINALFNVSDLADVCLKIAGRRPLLDNFGEEMETRAHGQLLKTLNEFFERRNQIAHSLNAAQSSGPTQVLKDIDMFNAFGKSLCETLEAHHPKIER